MLFKRLILKSKYLLWALKRNKNIHNYDLVKLGYELYQAKWENPHWQLRNIKNNLVVHNIYAENIKPVRSLERNFHRLKEDFQFQMTSWFVIDVRYSIFRRISYIDADNIRF